MWSHIPRIALLVAVLLLPPLSTAVAAPPQQDCGVLAPGVWQGPVEETVQGEANNLGGVSGLRMLITNHLTGQMNLIVTCEGSVTGTITFEYNVNWDVVGIQQSGCSGSGVVTIESGSLEESNDLPIISLNGISNSTETCLGESHSDPFVVKLETTEFTGDKVASSLPFMGDVINMGDYQSSLDNTPDVIWNTVSSWEITRTATHIVTALLPEYQQYFLKGIPFTNNYNITVDWQGASPGSVNLVFGEEIIPAAQAGSPEQWVAAYEIGGQPAGMHDLPAVAVTAGGQASPSFPHTLVIVPMPTWAQSLNLTNLPQPPAMLYRGTAHLPQEPLEYTVSLPDFIPVIGGTWGLTSTQINAAVEGTSLGGLRTAPITGSAGLALGGKTLSATVDGETRTVMSAEALTFDGGEAEIKLESLSYNKQVGLLNLVPGMSELSSSPIIGKLINALNSIINVNANVTADLGGTAHLGIQPDETLGILSGDVKSDVQVMVIGQVGIDGVAMAFVGGGGQGVLLMQIAPELALKECQVNLLFTAGYAVMDLLGGATGQYDGKYQLLQCEASAYAARGLAALMPPNSSYLQAMPQPANWQPYRLIQSSQTHGDVTETVLAQNLTVAAAPHLAAGPNGRLALVWMGETNAPSRLQGAEIFYRLYDGETWGDVVQLTRNGLFDQAPKAAFDAAGNLLIAWNQNQLQGLAEDTQLDEAFAMNMEVAYAVVAADGNPGDTSLLSRNEYLDFGVQLAAGQDGSVFAAWQHSPSNNLIGDASEPNALQVATWNGEAWSPASQAATLDGALWWQLAVNNAQDALLVTDQDTDGDLNTAADREIFAYLWSEAGWAAQQLTENAVADLGPRASFAPDGSLALAWLQGEQAMGLMASSLSELGAAQPQAWLPEATLSASFAQAQLLPGPEGRWALAWPDLADGQAELLLSLYTPESESWIAPQALLAGSEQEARVVGISREDTLLFSLLKLPVEPQEATMDDGTVVLIPSAAEQGDLAVWQVAYAFGQPAEGETPGSSFPLWLLGVLAALVLGAGVYFYLRRQKAN